MRQISDKAEVAIDFPDKFYIGGFGRDAEFDARVEDDGILVRLVRTGDEKRQVEIHLHYFLFANILEEVARSIAAAQKPIDDLHRDPLLNAAKMLVSAIEHRSAGRAE